MEKVTGSSPVLPNFRRTYGAPDGRRQVPAKMGGVKVAAKRPETPPRIWGDGYIGDFFVQTRQQREKKSTMTGCTARGPARIALWRVRRANDRPGAATFRSRRKTPSRKITEGPPRRAASPIKIRAFGITLWYTLFIPKYEWRPL